MAKFVLAGRADCPRYARAEMLADTLHAQLPHFNVNKVCNIYTCCMIKIDRNNMNLY